MHLDTALVLLQSTIAAAAAALAAWLLAGATVASLALGRFVFLPFHRASLAKAGLPKQNDQTHFQVRGWSGAERSGAGGPGGQLAHGAKCLMQCWAEWRAGRCMVQRRLISAAAVPSRCM